MEVHERKIGRVFRLEFKEGDNLLAEISAFVQKEGIREASLSILGAIGEGKIVTGFRSEKAGSSNLRSLGRKREFFGVGSLTWPAKPPLSAIRQGISWDQPRPHPHFHLSFGPDVGEEQKEVLVGHLEMGIAAGSITILMYELLS
jgi:predicted DNA-binding protein with PD1-like motif